MRYNNNLPKHWQLKKLGEVCQIIMGQSPPSATYNTNGIGLPFFQGKAEFTELYPVVEKWCNSPKKIAELNDILLSVRAPVGTTNIANIKCCIGRGLAAIRYDNYKYIFYFLKSIEQELDSKGTGTTFRAISGETIRMTEIPVPPPAEQQAIVEKIEELLSDLENGKEQLQTAQQQLKVYKQSLLKWAFEGKLTNKNVKEGELPKRWKWVKNKELLKYVTSGSRDWKQYYSNKGSRFVRTQDINSNKLDLANSAYMDLPEKVEGKRSLIEEGDILMTITGANVGKVAVVDFPIEDAYVSQSVALLKYQDKRITKFLWYFFQAQGFGKSFIDKLVYGVGRPVLSLENMREVDVISCPIEDQLEIIDELESKLTVCDKIEETISQSLQQAETLRQSILKKAFEGKLV